jgi:ribosomal protein L14E/L6E/L27E
METTSSLSIGQFVISKAGRDKGKIFIVLNVVDDKYLLVANGSLRKVSTPKRKKVLHVSLINKMSDEVKRVISDGKSVTDQMLRSEIEKLGM